VSAPRLTLACADHDLNQALISGQVACEGLELDVAWEIEDGERHARFLRDGAFDACEFSFANFLMARSRGMPFCGIPAFPNRKFRQSYIFCNTAAGIDGPRDLEGKRVGLRGWSATASVWARGVLQHYYRVDLRSISWFAPPEPLILDLPAWVRLTRLEARQGLEAMLLEGKLDAVIYPDVLEAVQRGDPRVRRLFPDYKAEEQAFYRTTGIFPISHLVVLRQEVVDRFPGAAMALLQAFRASRDACFRRLDDQQTLSMSWAGILLEEQRSLMGRDYWPYNVRDNRLAIETIVAYAHEQGLIPQPFAADQLFLPETVGDSRY